MKKNDWILVIAVASYSFLFYGQVPGINYVIFNIVLIACLLFRNEKLLKDSKWWLAAAGSLLSSFCVGYYSNVLSVIADLISLSLLSGLSFNSGSSVILTILFSLYSYFTSPIFMIIDWVANRKKEITSDANSPVKKSVLIIIPILITVLFFLMYQASNPLFKDFSKNINLDFISIEWIAFTFFGFILLYGFFYHRKIKFISKLDENATNDLAPGNNKITKLFGKELHIVDENFSGKLLFMLLNSLLLIVNILDINFLFIDGKLPKGVTHSAFVHQGIGMLITSIIFAIAIILFYFRGKLNFYEKSKPIKLLAYIWIIQNAFLLVSTALRNDLYINEYGLTYKRIGVYVYLLLTLIGLFTTGIKIWKLKTNNYLFRTNGWLFYAVLVISCFFSWDNIITNYNIHHAKWLQSSFLVNLSDTNLPQLFYLQQDTTRRKETYWEEKKDYKRDENDLAFQNMEYDEHLSWKLYSFLKDRETRTWKSWYYECTRIHNDLLYMNSHSEIKTLRLPGDGIRSLSLLKEFNNISELYLKANNLKNCKELAYFPYLKRLDLEGNYLTNLDGIEKLHQLEYLDLRRNFIKNYAPLYGLKQLKELHIYSNISSEQFKALQANLPQTKIVID